jgi:hypothetical protein
MSVKSSKTDWYKKWVVAVEKYCNFILVLLLCIPTLFISYKTSEYVIINFIVDQDAWGGQVRMVQPNKRELSDGSKLTIPAYAAYITGLVFLSAIGFLFWTFLCTYINMKLHHDNFKTVIQKE